ncbi:MULTISPECIES: GNAT family N-acetyltransferase [unclassified Oceanispirochaeta]|uniref:GNAT family N-acetyltransferase n=1 Tax=unclassified Oceanispirochaeta TaxID=2635722 RepID=UPI000E08E4EA|nr:MULTISPECIES: GNAT family N-acetyltransferase [unclassified Oceanispirochaeta]MBF9013990.1 GNAT family N-acetyltransferase [Oceanispirochaeta sp. M2]NPD70481.1 GNAT family N-acetyltransferase [Oceanispirochaeta sp. M1]RDG34251.1 GNAT family N-acetyltransferase [Oceanispirochaeta sp. M1]
MSYTIRPLQPSDEAALKHICFQTFRNGTDERYRELAGLHWAVPYLRYERENGFVATDTEGKVIGYVLSALNAREFRSSFKQRMSKEILTELKHQRRNFGLFEYLEVRSHFQKYEETLPPGTDRDYPAHLHIDILPEHQGAGLGGRLMDALIERLRKAECRGIHLGVGNDNTGAIRFYHKIGFEALKSSQSLGAAIHMGLKI